MADVQHASSSAGSEADAPVGKIALAIGAIGLTVALVFGISLGVFRFFSERPVEMPLNPMAKEAPLFPPAPRIEVAPAIEYQQLRTQEDQMLTTYGWVDRKAGIARIPIDRAIDLLLQRGFPVRKKEGVVK